MRKIIILILVLFAANGYAQTYYPMNQNYEFKRHVKVDSSFLAPSYADTATANTRLVSDLPGALIRVGNDFWMRNTDASAWLQFVNVGTGTFADTSFWRTDRLNSSQMFTNKLGTSTATELGIYTNDALRLKVPTTGISYSTGGALQALVYDTVTKKMYHQGIASGGYPADTSTSIQNRITASSVYTADGTLTGARVITMNGSNNLTFDNISATSQIIFSGEGADLSAQSSGDLWALETTDRLGISAKDIYLSSPSGNLQLSSDSITIQDTSLVVDATPDSIVGVRRNGNLYTLTVSPSGGGGIPTDTSISISNRIALKQDKSLTSYSFMANNTGSTADGVATTYKEMTCDTIGRTNLSWDGTPPTLANITGQDFCWSQIGKEVTVHFNVNYSSTGTSNLLLYFPLPAGMPNPYEPTGTGAASTILFIGSGTMETNLTDPAGTTGRCGIRVNSGDTGYDIFVTAPSGISARNGVGTLKYRTN